MGILVNELSMLYGAYAKGEAEALPPLEVQYADYAIWQRKWISGELLRGQAEYWKTTLAGAPALLELPTDHPRPAQQDYAGGMMVFGLDEALVQGLKALSLRHGATLFMTLLAAWAVLLSRLSGQEDVVIGTPIGEPGTREVEGLIGFFVNTLALRVDVSSSPTVAAFAGAGKGAGAGGVRAPGHAVRAGGGADKAGAEPGPQPAVPGDVGVAERDEGRLELPGLRLEAVAGAAPSRRSST